MNINTKTCSECPRLRTQQRLYKRNGDIYFKDLCRITRDYGVAYSDTVPDNCPRFMEQLVLTQKV